MSRTWQPIFYKVSNLLKVSIFIAKMRKPIIPKLVFLKKSRKLKRFKLLKHYNYGFPEECEFTPSSTPLIHYNRKALMSRRRRDIYSMFFLCKCLGGLNSKAEGEVDYAWPVEALPLPVIAGEFPEPLDLEDDEVSVDQRAERFIERFY